MLHMTALQRAACRAVYRIHETGTGGVSSSFMLQVEHQAPNYYTIITDPQDLGTIKDRLDEDEKTQASYMVPGI